MSGKWEMTRLEVFLDVWLHNRFSMMDRVERWVWGKGGKGSLERGLLDKPTIKRNVGSGFGLMREDRVKRGHLPLLFCGASTR